MNKIITILVLSIFFLVPTVSAWGPDTHLAILKDAINDPRTQNSPYRDLVLNNMDACKAGIVMADVSVFYYYTNFQKYAGLHDFNTQEKLAEMAKNDRERAFAFCYKLHLVEDGVSHNFYITHEIRSTGVPNGIIHPVAELGSDTLHKDPEARTIFASYKEFIPMLNEVSGRNWDNEGALLAKVIGSDGFYDKEGFALPEETFTDKIRKFTQSVSSIFVDEDASIPFYDQAVEETINAFNGVESLVDPAGEQALKSADKSSEFFRYLFAFIIFGVILLILWRLKVI